MNKEVETNSIKYNYVVIPIITISVIIINWFLTKFSSHWYATLKLPLMTPPSKAISIAWLLVYIPATAAIFFIWNKFERTFRFWAIVFFFIVNVILNVLWHYFFFYKHMVGVAFIESISLTFSVLVLILLIQPVLFSVALLLYPYALWTAFITYLNYMVWLIN